MKGVGNVWKAVLLAVSFCMVASATERSIDVHNSTIRIHVEKAGLFSAAGHEHWVSAPIDRGSLEDSEASAHVAFIVQARKLMVEPDKNLSAEKQAEVQRTMQEKVLESDKYPEISFRSSSVKKTAADSWIVTGILSLHGYSDRVSATVRRVQGKYVGRCRIKQTDFGIEPVRVGGGLVKVKNELEVEFDITAAPLICCESSGSRARFFSRISPPPIAPSASISSSLKLFSASGLV
jgi:polyisoprenoid-binding protein YceI